MVVLPEDSTDHYPLYSSLLLEESRGGYFQFCPSLPASVQWESKKLYKKFSYVHVPHGERFSNFELFGLQDGISTVL